MSLGVWVASLTDTTFATRLLGDLASRVAIEPKSGRVAITGSTEEQLCLLGDLLELDASIPSDEVRRIATDAVLSAAKSPGLTAQGFLSTASQLERQFLSRRPKRFVLVTEISIDPGIRLPRANEGGVTVSYPAAIPSPFVVGRRDIMDHAINSLYADPPTGYRWVRASVSSNSVLAAGDRALDAVQFLVSLMNLALNRRHGFRSSSGRRQPVNDIALAPVHTLHLPSGRPAAKSWWYEPTYVVPVRRIARDVDLAVQYSSKVRRRLHRLPYAEAWRGWVRNYGRALGEANWQSSYVLLWQALEAATGTPRVSNDVTVRRAAFLHDDVGYHSSVLDVLRRNRNNYVHAQEDPKCLESRLYLLKRYVEVTLEFHLAHAGDFETPSEAGEFLDLPATPRDLRRRLRLAEKAARFRGL